MLLSIFVNYSIFIDLGKNNLEIHAYPDQPQNDILYDLRDDGFVQIELG